MRSAAVGHDASHNASSSRDGAPSPAARAIPPGYHLLSIFIFALAIGVAAKSGIWLARTYVPEGAAAVSSAKLSAGTELKLIKLDNHYFAGESADPVRSYIFRKTGDPGLTLRESGLSLIYLDGDVRIRVVRDDSSVVLIDVLEGRLVGRRYFMDKNQLEDIVP